MKLIRKRKTTNLVREISEVSGYTQEEILTSRNHNVTPWARLGMYVAKTRDGKSFEEAAHMFGRHFTTGWLSVKKVEDSLATETDDNRPIKDTLTEVIALVNKLDSYDEA